MILRRRVGGTGTVGAVSSPARPVTVLDKADVLDGLFEVWDDIDALVSGLTDEQWLAATPLPGWCVRDVVAHVVGVESMLRGVATPDADIDMSTLKHVRNDIGILNERWVRRLRAVSTDELVGLLHDVIAARRTALREMTEERWNEITVTPAGPDTYGRFMRVRVFDCWMHDEDIRDAVQVRADAAYSAGPASRLALDEIAAAMGFVVGKLGRAPVGSRVTIELTGPLHRTINVVVEDRGRVVEDFAGLAPTVTIRLDGLLFTRLTGGRVAPARHVENAQFEGDHGVGRRVVEHLNYVI